LHKTLCLSIKHATIHPFNAEQGSCDCEYQLFLSLLVPLDEEIEPRSADYEADALTTIMFDNE